MILFWLVCHRKENIRRIKKENMGECQLCVFESCLSVPISLWKILCVRVCVCGGGGYMSRAGLFVNRKTQKKRKRKKEKGEGRL